MNQFKINPDFVHKQEGTRLLLVSTESDKNEVYEFEGKASFLLLKLIEAGTFTQKFAEEQCVELGAIPADLASLWALCLAESIIVPA